MADKRDKAVEKEVAVEDLPLDLRLLNLQRRIEELEAKVERLRRDGPLRVGRPL